MIKQGDIWYADLNPVKGSEQAGFRPVVVISGNLLNEHLPVVICCPLTTKVKNYKGNVVLKPDLLNKLNQESEILTFHIRAVSKARLTKRAGCISKVELVRVKTCLNEILTY